MEDQFSASFEQGEAPTPEQCSDWNQYRSGLGFGYSAITQEGRPCVFDERWGGVQIPVCGAPSQAITFRCE